MKKKQGKNFFILPILAVTLLLSSCSESGSGTIQTDAEGNWIPSEDITLRVPAAAGGAFDTSIRLFAQGVQKSYGSTAMVANLAGANGIVAASDLLLYDPSPYELMGGNIGMFTSAPLFNPEMALKLDDYELLGSLTSDEFVLFVSPEQTGIETFEDLIAYGETEKIFAGSQAPGNAGHGLITAIFGDAGAEFTSVISTGANLDIISVVAGDITVSIGYPSVGAQYYAEGSVIPVLCFSAEPCTAFEGIEVPTAISKGYDIEFYANNFLMAKKGADPVLLQQMYDKFYDWHETDEFVELASNIGYAPNYQTGDELKAEILDSAELFQGIFDKYYAKD